MTVWPFPRSIRGSSWNFHTNPILERGSHLPRALQLRDMLPSLMGRLRGLPCHCMMGLSARAIVACLRLCGTSRGPDRKALE